MPGPERLSLTLTTNLIYYTTYRSNNISYTPYLSIYHDTQVCLDLAMPGPERLSGECALSGGVAIVSNRWNGASAVDFPGLIRVDHQVPCIDT